MKQLVILVVLIVMNSCSKDDISLEHRVDIRIITPERFDYVDIEYIQGSYGGLPVKQNNGVYDFVTDLPNGKYAIKGLTLRWNDGRWKRILKKAIEFEVKDLPSNPEFSPIELCFN